jgi:hypothetical protein
MSSNGQGQLALYVNDLVAVDIQNLVYGQVETTINGSLATKALNEKKGDLTVAGNLHAGQQLTVDNQLTANAALEVKGSITGSGGNITVEANNKGTLGPKLRLINTAGGAKSAAAIELSGYDTRMDANGDIPAVRISCEDDNNYSGNLIFSTKGHGAKEPLTERLRLTSDGHIRLNNKAPMIIKHYTDLTNPAWQDTGIRTDEYIAFIGGYAAYGYDLNEINDQNWQMKMDESNGNWYINLNMAEQGSSTWEVFVIAVHRNFIELQNT